MAKYDVKIIEDQAITTRHNYRGRPGSDQADPLTIRRMRNYIDKVLYLCKKLKQANAKIERLSKTKN